MVCGEIDSQYFVNTSVKKLMAKLPIRTLYFARFLFVLVLYRPLNSGSIDASHLTARTI